MRPNIQAITKKSVKFIVLAMALAVPLLLSATASASANDDSDCKDEGSFLGGALEFIWDLTPFAAARRLGEDISESSAFLLGGNRSYVPRPLSDQLFDSVDVCPGVGKAVGAAGKGMKIGKEAAEKAAKEAAEKAAKEVKEKAAKEAAESARREKGGIRGQKGEATKAQRKEIQDKGQKNGCRTCGEFVRKYFADHVPATTFDEMLGSPEYWLYPHCPSCSGKQGAEVKRAVKTGRSTYEKVKKQ